MFAVVIDTECNVLKTCMNITGEELWSHYAAHEIFSINCNADISGHGVNDCIGGGRAGVSLSYMFFLLSFRS